MLVRTVPFDEASISEKQFPFGLLEQPSSDLLWHHQTLLASHYLNVMDHHRPSSSADLSTSEQVTTRTSKYISTNDQLSREGDHGRAHISIEVRQRLDRFSARFLANETYFQ